MTYLSPQQLKLLKWPVEGSIGYGVSVAAPWPRHAHIGPIRPLWLLATKSHRRPVSRNADVTFIGARERTLSDWTSTTGRADSRLRTEFFKNASNASNNLLKVVLHEVQNLDSSGSIYKRMTMKCTCVVCELFYNKGSRANPKQRGSQTRQARQV